MGAAVFSSGKIGYKNVIRTPGTISEDLIIRLVKSEDLSKINAIIVSSVVPDIDGSLSHTLNGLFKTKTIFLDHKTDTGIKLRIDNPEEIGADRIADSAGALHFFDPPLIVLDSGTAITFDIINHSYEYIGGSIIPGIEISLKSLAENTAKLEMNDFSVPDSIIGKNTRDSINAGLFYSISGGINYMIDEYNKILGGNAKVILTGGLIPYMKTRMTKVDLFEPDLIYHGLRIIHERLKNTGQC